MGSFLEMKEKNVREYYPLYIDGAWCDAESGEKMDVLCPCNGEKLSEAAVASQADVDKAVAAARAAFPAWKKLPLAKRYELLMECYGRIMENLNKLSSIEALDMGRPMGASIGTTKGGAQLFPYYASLIRTHEDGTNSETSGSRVMVVREPLGVVGAIVAWNGPMLQSFWKLAPALAAGNCVVIKPSSSAALSVMEMIGLLGEILPKGVVNVINGPGSTTGQYLIDHPGIDKISLTGSTDVGITAALAGAKHVIPVTLELGGKSAGIYFEDLDDMDKAAKEIARHVTSNSGQVCRMQSRVLVQESIYDEMIEKVKAILESTKLGAPWQEDTQMGPIVYEGHMEKVLGYIELGKSEGARLVTGGYRVTEGELAKGYYIAPTVFADVDNSMRIAQEEIFGPVICMMKFKTEEEAIAIANDSKYGLGSGIFTGDLRRALRVAEAIEAGDVRINAASGRTVGGSAFGGYKYSGVGRENYKTTYDAYTQIKTISF